MSYLELLALGSLQEEVWVFPEGLEVGVFQEVEVQLLSPVLQELAVGVSLEVMEAEECLEIEVLLWWPESLHLNNVQNQFHMTSVDEAM